MVGFPGLGIADFNLPSIIFSVGPFSLHWYGLVIAAGFLLGTMYAMKRAPGFGYTPDDIVDMLICAVPSAIVGARLYYVAFNWSYYKTDTLAIIRIWDGGMAIYGAVIAAVTAAALFCWVKRYNIGAMLDLGGLGLLIGQGIGRWGNFFNREVFGVETELPWRMSIDSYVTGYTEVHPLFFYEFLWNGLGFVLLHFLSRKRKFNGQVFLVYVAWYGLGRGFLEGLRDSEYSLMLGNMRVSQFVGFASFALTALILGYQLLMKHHEPEKLLAWVKEREARPEEPAGESDTEEPAETAPDAPEETSGDPDEMGIQDTEESEES